jgi:malate synthase
MTTAPKTKGSAGALRVHAPIPEACAWVLSDAALAFVGDLERRFGARRRELLAMRKERQARLDAGDTPDFLASTAGVRAGDWKVSPVPARLLDRRVEITGPTDRKMVINALNSGACVFMADFEDSLAPTWHNVVDGQKNLAEAVRRTIGFTDAASGKSYRLVDEPAILFVRPRGWHLDEKNVTLDGQRVSASLFDFGLFFFHNAKEQIARGATPCFYLPKMESHLEARLWNDVFRYAQERLDIPQGTIKATVLIETILAAFEMDEILYELREHSAGLNCGRWDYIFSFIKKFRAHANRLVPDRASVTMTQRFLRSYSQLLIKTCHRRGAFAMGGMAAQIPIKNDPQRNEQAFAKVRADKQREANDGHDGTWVAHPGLVAVAREEFDRVLKDKTNQLHVRRDDVHVTAEDLLCLPEGQCTEQGLRQNLNVGVQYVEAWLCGNGCVPLHDLMEDAATAEISRVQVWQWLRHGARLQDGRKVDAAIVKATLAEELADIERRMTPAKFATRKFAEASALFLDMVFAAELPDFLTSAAYERI